MKDMKKRFCTTVLTTLCALSITSGAEAGIYTNDMGKCLVQATTPQDRSDLVRWLFSAAALNPAVKGVASISPKQIDASNKVTADLFMRLLTVSCREKTQAALRYEGPQAIQSSFQILGQVAGREIFSSPEVVKAMGGMNKYLDVKKLQALMVK